MGVAERFVERDRVHEQPPYTILIGCEAGHLPRGREKVFQEYLAWVQAKRAEKRRQK